MLVHAIARSLKDGGWRYLWQRCGLRSPVHQKDEPCQWIHAASVGEIITVLPLLKALQERPAAAPLLVTTTTPTGAKVLLNQPLQGVEHRYLPIDTPGSVRRFLNQFSISSVWVVETEIWPWLFACCHQQSIPITIINARLSERTMARATGMSGKALSQALVGVRVLARSEIDAQRYIELGAEPDKIQTLGNLKYARARQIEAETRLLDRHYVVAASTHEDEEQQLAHAWHVRNSNHLLVIVPRHPERGLAIQKQLQHLGIEAARRSNNETLMPHHRVYVADTVGELMAWYAFARAAFVGGSLTSRGGQNMLEPARYACPTVVGPNTSNFEDIMQRLLDNQAVHVAEDALETVNFLASAASGSDELTSMAKRAEEIAKDNEHVLERYVEQLL